MKLLLLALIIVAACGGSKAAEPAAPAEAPPLPPASGTIIGILLDDGGQLGLRDDQRAALREIDSGLAARNAELDRGAKRVVRGGGPKRGGGGGGMGGMRSARGGMRGARGGMRGSAAPPGGSSAPDHRPPPDRGRHARAMNDRDALTRAMALLDEPQQSIARRILEDHDVDVDLVLAGPQGGPAEPAP